MCVYVPVWGRVCEGRPDRRGWRCWADPGDVPLEGSRNKGHMHREKPRLGCMELMT